MAMKSAPNMEPIARQCDALVEQFRQALNQREGQLAAQYQAQVRLRLEGLKKERKRMQAKLGEISFFKFSQKRSAQEELERLDKCIAEYSGPAALQQARMENLRKMEKAVAQYRTKLDGYLARRFPSEALRKQAEKEFASWYEGSNSQLKDIIYAALAQKPGMTQEQIAQCHPRLQERSQRRISFVLKEMLEKGEISERLADEQAYYSVAAQRIPRQPDYPDVDYGYEDPEAAAQPIPQPPAVEKILS